MASELHASSSYWTVYKFFASQSQHKYKIIIFFSGEANDEANFSFFILLHKRAKPAIPLLRQVVAFAPKVIKCAVGAIKSNKMRLKPKGFIESSTLGAIMNERRNGQREGPEGWI